MTFVAAIIRPMAKRTRARAQAEARPFHERSPLLFLAIATAVALLPFVNKGFIRTVIPR